MRDKDRLRTLLTELGKEGNIEILKKIKHDSLLTTDLIKNLKCLEIGKSPMPFNRRLNGLEQCGLIARKVYGRRNHHCMNIITSYGKAVLIQIEKLEKW